MTSIFSEKKTMKKSTKPGWVMLLIFVLGMLGEVYPNIKPYVDPVKNVVNTIESVEPAKKPDNVICDVETGVCTVPQLKMMDSPKLILPDMVDEYSLVPISTNAEGQYYDVVVMTIKSGNIAYIETARTINDREWVFTGPPGNYSVKLTAFNPDTGFKSLTGNVKINGNIPPPTPVPTPTPTPSPVPTPVPNPTPTPQPKPVVVPNTEYGFTKLAYDQAIKLLKNDRAKMLEIADNFESISSAIAAGGIKTVNDANAKLGEANRRTLNVTKGIPSTSPYYDFFMAWSKHSTELNKAGKLRNIITDYQTAYDESAEGIRLALKQ